MTAINQKQYLKKYLRLGKVTGEKKKKKKDKSIVNRLKIIDDDLEFAISQEIQEDIAAANEYAPQIVAVIDERPPSMRVNEETKSKLWTPIGESTGSIDESERIKLVGGSFKLNNLTNDKTLKFQKQNYLSPIVSIKKEADFNTKSTENIPIQIGDGKFSLSEKIKSEENIYLSGENKSVVSPKTNEDNSPPRRNEDNSPPRRNKRDYSPPIEDQLSRKIDDNSPPRRNKRNSSPPVDSRSFRKVNEDNSPPRRNNKKYSSAFGDHSSRKVNGDNSPPRNKKDSLPTIDDNHLYPRKRLKDENKSPPRKRSYEHSSISRRKNKDDLSPQNSKHRKIYDDCSRLSSVQSRYESTKLLEPKSRVVLPQRSDVSISTRKNSRWADETREISPEKIEKTLSGKVAGLQNAKDLAKEISSLRKKEDEMFKKMSADVSGKNASTIVRGKKDDIVDKEKQINDNRLQEKYDQWGKGLKQVQNMSEKNVEQLHEMSKPLARYADDDDLEKFLKEQEREGDPMLAYIRKKKKKKAVEAGIPEKPMYMGEFMPNRFAIHPGYRWDGVDRSNGYETRWFQVQNSKKAHQEESLKWSVEDM